jgi:photosystem II stability/assembly factor-like uncharacterized protein
MRILAAALAAAVSLSSGPAQAAWRMLETPVPDATLRAVGVTGPQAFHVAGSKGTYAVTSDGGRTWRRAAPAGTETLDFRGLSILDSHVVILMSAGDGPAGQARLYRSPDTGRTWSLAYETRLKGAFLDAVVFRNRREGLVLGDPIDGRWFLLRTADGGKSWTQAEGPAVKPGEAAFAASDSALFLDSANLWIVSGGLAKGRVFRSQDDGRSWSVADTPLAASATAGVFGGVSVGGGRAVVVGGDYKDELRDAPSIAVGGGDAWTLPPHAGTPRLLEGVARLNAKTLIAVGPRGTSVSADNGATWRQVDDEAFHAVDCQGGVCVAAGGKGRVGVWEP